MDRNEIIALDRAHVWHPYTPMDEWVNVDPIVVAKAHGAWLEDIDGTRYLDGNSSWYVATLGHAHPRLLRVVAEQSVRLAHCSLAGIAHEQAARLAAELVDIAPRDAGHRLTRVFFVDDGSTAVDAAVKMCAQAWSQL
ncbi:MAG: aminotransferase class III-fold pyridoxal phosphate-dependent enzyme, partial [Myxococcota bacterium]|nr:aminotransferase class III-fold pyridoxal phosphate-dependent enzyme [Myxococcota bacterium]